MSNLKHGGYAAAAGTAYARKKAREYLLRHPGYRKAYNHAYKRGLPTPRVSDFPEAKR